MSEKKTEEVVENPATEVPAEVVETEAPADVENAPEGDAAPEPQEYAPSFKYKVRDEEKEFDEWLRPVVKNAEQERAIRELYERSAGLDFARQREQSLKQQFEQIQPEYQQFVQAREFLQETLSKGDLKTFFDAHSIPEDEVLKYAVEVLKYRQMAPEERAKIDQYRQVETQARQYEGQTQQLNQVLAQQAAQMTNMQLDMHLSRPDIADLVNAYDSRVGKPGAFKEQVIAVGNMRYYASGGKENIPVDEAVKQFIQMAGVTATQESTGNPVQPKVVQKKPMLPNATGTGTSPVKKPIRSLDQIRALANQANA